MSKKIGLVWLHNDLRLHDNPTLHKAAKACDELLILYATYDFPTNRGQSYYYNQISSNRRRFLHESLGDLNASLQQLGNKLLFIENASLDSLITVINDNDVTDVFYSQTADYDHNERIELVTQKSPQVGCHESNTATLFDDLPMVSLPKVFTNFRENIEKNSHLLQQKAPLAQTPIPQRLPPVPSSIDRSLPYFAEQPLVRPGGFVGGETYALAHIANYFASEAPAHYKVTRNALDEWTHSTKFSAWLGNGTLSVRTLINTLRDYEHNVIANDSTYWIWFELLWREYFYWYADTHQHKLFTLKGINQCKSRTCFYGERYERWKNGNTPYPIVNACMNQLRETGYLSNRGRQIAASCFVHELGMDWRYGATYYEQQLLDFDVASNWGNWQYIAGTGADPRGGRRFNLAKQTKQHDPENLFIDRWNGDTDCQQIDSVDAADWPVM